VIVARTALRSVLRRPRQALLVGVAITAATAFAAVALLVAANARVALVAFGMVTPPAADVVVVPRGDVAPGAALEVAERVRALPGVVDVAVEHLGDVEVEAGGVTTTWKLTSDPGGGPLSALRDAPDVGPLEPGGIVLGRRTAERVGVDVGDTVVAGGHELVVVGVGPVREFGQDVGLVHPSDAVTIGGMPPVQMFVVGDVDLAAVRAVAGDAAVTSGPEQRDREARSVGDTLAGVLGGLSVFVALAVVSAVVIVSSTFRIVLARRAAELALLRCVGATRRQVHRSVLAEAACVGLLGGLVGTGAGLGVAAGLVAAARAADLVSAPFVATPGGLVACVALSVAATLAAALPSARAAGRTAPVVALGAARSSDARPVRVGARLVTAGALTLTAVATGAVAVPVARTDQLTGLALAALSGTLVFAVLVAVGPFLVRWAARAVRPLGARSAALRLAVSNAHRSSRRTAAMTTVLTLGVGLAAALLVAVAGVTADARESVVRTFGADALIPVDVVADPDALVAALAAHPAVDARVVGTDILLDPAPGTDPAALRDAVLDTVPAGTSVYWAGDVLAGIEQTVAVGQLVGAAMIGVTLVVAMVGVVVTLALSVAERRQEIALVRALGVSRAGARRSVAAEAGLASAVGATLGVVLGGAYGVLALRVLDMPAGQPPLDRLALLGAGVVGAAVLAAAVPMRSAGRVEPAIGLAAR
jgi:putative ABC transport system permease protein